jgi:hypothetical protein
MGGKYFFGDEALMLSQSFGDDSLSLSPSFAATLRRCRRTLGRPGGRQEMDNQQATTNKQQHLRTTDN